MSSFTHFTSGQRNGHASFIFWYMFGLTTHFILLLRQCPVNFVDASRFQNFRRPFCWTNSSPMSCGKPGLPRFGANGTTISCFRCFLSAGPKTFIMNYYVEHMQSDGTDP